MPLTARQSIELFHLAFLRALVAKGEDKGLIALKGGCNLRFYFGSVRYSEDIDFDVMVTGKGTLQNKVDRLLQSPLVITPLKANGIEIVETSAAKQTETTQRWKVGLRMPGSSVELRTKIEFSRRTKIEQAAFEGVQHQVLQPYRLSQVLAQHYDVHAAIAQKIHALAAPTEPQARDVFDLDLLFAQPNAGALRLSRTQAQWLPDAIAHAIGISSDEYRATVVAYLDPEQAAPYAHRSAWDAMQDAVVSRLQGLR